MPREVVFCVAVIPFLNGKRPPIRCDGGNGDDIAECVRSLEKAGKTVKVYPGVWNRPDTGAARARAEAAKTMDKVRAAVGL